MTITSMRRNNEQLGDEREEGGGTGALSACEKRGESRGKEGHMRETPGGISQKKGTVNETVCMRGRRGCVLH